MECDEVMSTGWAIMMLFVGVPAGWALIWAFCVAVDKWRHKR